MSKYSAIKTIADGIEFASKKEAKRYLDLKVLLRAGQISDLELQPKFPLVVSGKKVCTYVADFAYTENRKRIVEDVKGVKTPVYRLKRKLLLALVPDLDHREI